MLNPTRFTATVQGRCHLGHAWAAFVNCSLGDSTIIFRAEDVMARASSMQATQRHIEESIEDFTRNLSRFGSPVRLVIRQSERLARYEEVNHACFGGRFDWRATGWGAHIGFPYPHPSGADWESSQMAILSRVLDDHDYGVRDVVMGADLEPQARLYLDRWEMIFPNDAPPKLFFIPLVMAGDSLGLDGFTKISKSHSRNFFLSNLSLDPLKTMFGLAERQMHDTLWAEPLADIPRNLMALRQWVGKASWAESWNLQPDAVTKEDLEAWS